MVFFLERVIFPSAPRHPSGLIGQWGVRELARGRCGSARAVEEADDGVTGITWLSLVFGSGSYG